MVSNLIHRLLSYIRPLAITLLLALPIACSTIPAKQKLLFQYHHINWAAGFQCHGFYVDRDGNVYGYKCGKPGKGRNIWEGDTVDYFTEDEILKNLISKKLVSKLDKREVKEMSALIKAALGGELSERIHSGYDSGGTIYSAYIYDPAKEKYKQVFLHLDGDYTRQNLSPSAIALTEWLRSIAINTASGWYSD